MTNDRGIRRWCGLVLLVLLSPLQLAAQQRGTQRPLGMPATAPERISPNVVESWSQRVLPLPDRSIADVQGQKALLDELSRWADLRSQLEQFKQLAEQNPEALRSLQGALNEDQRNALQDILGENRSKTPVPIPRGFRSPNGFPSPRNQSQDGEDQTPEPKPSDPKPSDDALEQSPSVNDSAPNRSSSADESDLFKDVPSYENIDPFAPLPPQSSDPQSPNLQSPDLQNPGTPGSMQDVNQSRRPRATPTQTPRFPNSQPGREELRSQTPQSSLAPLEPEIQQLSDRLSDDAPALDEPSGQFSPNESIKVEPSTNPSTRESSDQGTRSNQGTLSDGNVQQLQSDVRRGNVRKAFQEILADARKESAQRRQQAQEAAQPIPFDTDDSATNPTATNSPSDSTMSSEIGRSDLRETIQDSQRLPLNSENTRPTPRSSNKPTEPFQVPQGHRSGMQNFDSGTQNSQQFSDGNRNNFRREDSTSEGWTGLFGEIAQSLYDTLSTAPEAPESQQSRPTESNAGQSSDEGSEAFQAPVFLLQTLLGLGIVAAIIWAVLRSRQSSEQQHTDSISASPLWQVENGRDLMIVFHQLALGHLRRDNSTHQSWFTKARRTSTIASVAEPWWNHRRAATLMLERQPGHDDGIELLTRLYERVRYSAVGDHLDSNEVDQVRHAVEKLRGC